MANYASRAVSCGIGEDLKIKAVAADAASRRALPLAILWAELVSRQVRVIAAFNTLSRCFVVTAGSPLADGDERSPSPRIARRNVEILRRILLGDAQKVIAMDFGLSSSSVNTVAAQTLRSMGMCCLPTRASVVLLIAAHAHHQDTHVMMARESVVAEADRAYRVLSVPRPDLKEMTMLSDAERSVVDLLLERRSNAEIARLRSTSPRTIANQLANVVQKLRVGGRCGIVHRLVCGHHELWPAPTAFNAQTGTSSLETGVTQFGNLPDCA